MPKPVDLWRVTLTDGYFYEKEKCVRETTLPALFASYEKTGRVRSFKLNWRHGEPGEPHIFWDSDIAKWIEGVAYTLSTARNAALEATVDALVDDMVKGQTADGYFNVRYQTVDMANRFTRRSDHELYCAGHLIEAAVAYHRATGKTAMLDVMRRYVNYIEDIFYNNECPENFKTPGHEEIELALVKLYEVTGEQRYLTLAKHFIDTRGLSETERTQHAKWFGPEYAQDHLPVRQQTTAEGHAVRALYLYAGMADIARVCKDETLADTCKALFDNIVNKKMYVTGGLGGNYHGEAFSFNYDLPNELAYAETCASIAFVFFAQRMFLLTGEARYIDAMETMLYNAIPAGLSVSGDRFFYTNPLEMHPERRAHFLTRGHGQFNPEDERPDDFGCSCCPPNVIRLFASVKGYMYHTVENTLYVNLYGSSTLEWDGVHIEQATGYPWDGTVNITVRHETGQPVRRTLCLRLPVWCGGYRVTVNGTDTNVCNNNGYLTLDRAWSDGDCMQLHMDMPVRELYAHPSVHYNAGRVAVACGPIVYCAEGADNNSPVVIPIKSTVIKQQTRFRTTHDNDLLGGVTVIDCDAIYPLLPEAGDGGALYQTSPPAYRDTVLRLIPYAVWANRGKNEMNVWLLKENQ